MFEHSSESLSLLNCTMLKLWKLFRVLLEMEQNNPSKHCLHTEKTGGQYLQLSRPRPPKQLSQGVEFSRQASLAARRPVQVDLVDVLVQTFEIFLQRHERNLLRQVRAGVGDIVGGVEIAVSWLQRLMRRMVMVVRRMELQLRRGRWVLRRWLMVVAILIVAGR